MTSKTPRVVLRTNHDFISLRITCTLHEQCVCAYSHAHIYSAVAADIFERPSERRWRRKSKAIISHQEWGARRAGLRRAMKLRGGRQRKGEPGIFPKNKEGETMRNQISTSHRCIYIRSVWGGKQRLWDNKFESLEHICWHEVWTSCCFVNSTLELSYIGNNVSADVTM